MSIDASIATDSDAQHKPLLCSPDVARKIAGWKERLLDFTRRNPLLSFPEKSIVRLDAPPFTPDELFHRLTGGTKSAENALTFLRETLFLPLPPPMPNGEATPSVVPPTPPLPPGPALKAGQKKVSEADHKRIALLRAKSNLSLSEQGINILFVTFGSLFWLDPKTNTRTRSPLLLVPVALSILPGGSGFVLRRFDDDVHVNPTLRSRLAQDDIKFSLPGNADDAADIGSASEYLARVRDAVQNSRMTAQWEVVSDECFLGRFSFLKLVMYEDLVRQTDAACVHPLIATLAGNTQALAHLPAVSVPPADELDDFQPAEKSLHVLPADPSQERAVLAARLGQSFVLQGPPGTGKTQTIANIIAACIADGKRVLFVSEKMAALDAVYKRLHGAGLSPLCLEAHSHKAGKKDILASLQQALEAAPTKGVFSDFRDADALNEAQSRLNRTVRALHEQREPMGISVYEAYGFIAQTPPLPPLPFVLGDLTDVGADEFRQREQLAQQLAASQDLFEHAETHPWRAVRTERFTSDLQNVLRSTLFDLHHHTSEQKQETQTLTHLCGLPPLENPTPVDAKYVQTIAQLLSETPRPPREWLQKGDKVLGELRSVASAARDKWRDCARRRSDLENVYESAFFALPHTDLAERLTTRHDALLAPALGPAWAEGTSAFYTALADTLRRVEQTITRLGGSGAKLAALCGLPAPQTLSEARFVFRVAQCALVNPRPLSGWFTNGGNTIPNLLRLARDAQTHQAEQDKQKAGLTAAGYLPALFALDVTGLGERFARDYTNMLRFFKPAYWRDMGTLRQTMGPGGTLKNRDPRADLQITQSVNEHTAWLTSHSEALSQTFGSHHYKNEETDWPAVIDAVSQTQTLCSLFPGGPPQALQNGLIASGSFIETLTDQSELFGRQLREAEKELTSGGELPALAALPHQETLPIGNVPLGEIAAWYAAMQAGVQDLARARETVLQTRRVNPFDADGSEPPVASRRLALQLVQAGQLLTDEAELQNEGKSLQVQFARFFEGQNTNWEYLLDALHWAGQLRHAFLGDRFASDALLPDALLQAACFPRDEQPPQIAQHHTALLTYREKTSATWRTLGEHLRLDADNGNQPPPENGSFVRQEAWVTERINALPDLERWLDFARHKTRCEKVGMLSFWEVITRRKPPAPLILPAFRAAFYRRFVEGVAETVPELSQFRGHDHEALRLEFARLDRALIASAPTRIRASTNSRKKRLNGIGSDLGELGILKKQLAMKRPWAVRKLLSSIPNILFLLKPCLLMSPLSVSLFLDADRIAFDLVVFDEASQIFTESAVGSLLRAKQTIIAGDTKQLPPTAFFKGLSDEEDEDEESEGGSGGGEFESVLSAASACANDDTRFANHPLLWHYRSRHESLISFSREHFYERLQTFPSAGRLSALQFEYVPNGVYHGGTGNRRDNPIEAALVAQMVAAHVRAHPQQSVGVITMSEAQQNAVTEAVEKLKNADPTLAGLLPEDGPECFFVKNIENVQGDERDVIFLSIGYGRDAKTGTLRLNFGPLNKDGGERRLNVAVTRARLRCVTVSSIMPSEIDPARTDKRGPLLLRAYMEKAIQAASISAEASMENDGKDGLVQGVADALKLRGHTVQQNVGLFDFRIDIGVVDDENLDRFLLGIECDGPNYLSGETARARERLRDEVLRGLDWRLYRLWSADWARDPAAVLQAIEDAINQAKRGEPELVASEPNEIVRKAPLDEAAEQKATPPEAGQESNAAEGLREVQEPLANLSPTLLPGLDYYTPMSDANLAIMAHAFWACDEAEQATLLTKLVDAEGPLPFAVAAQKIASAAGYSRTGNRLTQTVRDAANTALVRGALEEQDGFLWSAGLKKAPPARVPHPDDSPRPVEQVCLEEIGAVILALLRAAVGMGQNEAIDETARLLGYARTGPTVRERITSALSLLEISDQVQVQGGQVYTFE